MSRLRYYSRQFEISFELIRNLFMPRKKDVQLYFDEIGLTLSIPGYLTVLSKRQILAGAKRAKRRGVQPATPFASGENCRTLFVARNAENYYMSGIMISLNGRKPTEAKNEYYEYLQAQMNSLKDLYKKYARVFVEERSVDGLIGEVPFEKTEITRRIPEEVLAYIYFYHGFHRDYQIILCAAFLPGKKGMDMLRYIEEGRFGGAAVRLPGKDALPDSCNNNS